MKELWVEGGIEHFQSYFVLSLVQQLDLEDGCIFFNMKSLKLYEINSLQHDQQMQ